MYLKADGFLQIGRCCRGAMNCALFIIVDSFGRNELCPYMLTANTLSFQHLGLRNLLIMIQGICGTRPNIAHYQWRMQYRLLTVCLIAYAHSDYMTLFMQNLQHIGTQTQVCSLGEDMPLQFTR